MNKNILLIGFMGCGKSTVGRALSKRVGKYFLDTDNLIESSENKYIKNIFELYGENHFRNLELECANWLKSSVKSSVISCGGGFIYVEKYIKLSEIGDVIYLDVDFEQIVKRLSGAEIDKRPLFKDNSKARELYEHRVALYKSVATKIVDGSKTVDEVIEQIL
ncbi:MAG: shikimate kinase [Campylobacterales bacterium]|nr:shikimate kinase [Campylobacterales bacterium]